MNYLLCEFDRVYFVHVRVCVFWIIFHDSFLNCSLWKWTCW